MKKQGKTNSNANTIIVLIVVFVVMVVIDTIFVHIVATSNLPFWVKFWFFS